MSWPFVPFPMLLAQAPVAAQPAAAQPAAAQPAAPTVPAQPGAAKTAQPAPAAQPESALPTFIVLAPLLLLAYIMMIRPQQQQEKKRRKMVNELKKNDKVLTSAGIYGTVVSVDAAGEKVTLRVDDEKQVRFVFSKASIVRVIDPATEKTAESSS